MTKDEFDYIINIAASQHLIDYANAKCGDVSCTAIVDFYKSDNNDLKFSFGRATVKFYYKEAGHVIIYGFYDKYDFDKKPWGTRSKINEAITRLYNLYSDGKAFEIKYP